MGVSGDQCAGGAGGEYSVFVFGGRARARDVDHERAVARLLWAAASADQSVSVLGVEGDLVDVARGVFSGADL